MIAAQSERDGLNHIHLNIEDSDAIARATSTTRCKVFWIRPTSQITADNVERLNTTLDRLRRAGTHVFVEAPMGDPLWRFDTIKKLRANMFTTTFWACQTHLQKRSTNCVEYRIVGTHDLASMKTTSCTHGNDSQRSSWERLRRALHRKTLTTVAKMIIRFVMFLGCGGNSIFDCMTPSQSHNVH